MIVMDNKPPTELEKLTVEGPRPNLFTDFWHFLRHNKKWWLLPFIIVLVLLSLLMLLSSSSVAPFIYTLI